MVNKPSVYKDIKQSYYSGITEVYKPCGYNFSRKSNVFNEYINQILLIVLINL